MNLHAAAEQAAITWPVVAALASIMAALVAIVAIAAWRDTRK